MVQTVQLVPSLVIAAGSLQDELVRQLDAFAAHWGLTYAKVRILHIHASRRCALSCADIGRSIGASRQSVQKQTNMLIDQGLLIKTTNTTDPRGPLFDMTSEGTRIFQEMKELWDFHLTMWIKDLAQIDVERAELENAINLVRSVMDVMQQRPLPVRNPNQFRG